MKSNKRVDGLFQGLTAKERGILALRSMKAREEEDSQVKDSMPDDQIDAYNRLVALMNGVNCDLGPYVLLIKAFADVHAVRLGWLLTVNLLTLGTDCDRTLDIAENLNVALVDALTRGVEHQWQELQAVDQMTEEVASEFGGEDPMLPELRETCEDARTSLNDTIKTLKDFGKKVRLRKPTEDLQGQVRRLVHRELEQRLRQRRLDPRLPEA